MTTTALLIYGYGCFAVGFILAWLIQHREVKKLKDQISWLHLTKGEE